MTSWDEGPTDDAKAAGVWMFRALRLRHGARVACKRLREERDVARELAFEMVSLLPMAPAAMAALTDDRDRLTAERDAARLELRALEWLALHGFPVGRDGGRVMAVYREDDQKPDWHPSWESAARALGWEG